MIYFLQAEAIGRIKIGYCRRGNLKKRLQALRGACPVPLHLLATISGSLRTEQRLHERFSEDRRHGEWFRPSHALLRFIYNQADAKPQKRQERRLRRHVAHEWLLARFKEKEIWPSHELLATAQQHGISRDALFEANLTIQASKIQHVSALGKREWLWVAPPLKEESA